MTFLSPTREMQNYYYQSPVSKYKFWEDSPEVVPLYLNTYLSSFNTVPSHTL